MKSFFSVVATVLLLVAVIALLAPANIVAAGVDGGAFGMIVSKGASPEFAFGILTDFSIDSLGGKLFERVEVAALYSDKKWDTTNELYAIRSFVIKQLELHNFYVGFGGGTWLMFNTGGSDMARMAAKFAMGYKNGPLIIQLANETVHMKTPDWNYLHLGVVLKL